MSGIKPQTLKIVSIFNHDSQENNPLEANQQQSRLKKQYYDARDLRLQELEDCQKVYKVVKKETTTKWILLQKLEECQSKIKLELQYLKKLVRIAQGKDDLNKQKQQDLSQLLVYLNKFEIIYEQANSSNIDQREREKLLKSIDEQQRVINEWKRIVPKDDVLLDRCVSSSFNEWKQIQLRILDESLIAAYELKSKIMSESDCLGDEELDSEKVVKYQNQINDIRRRLSLDQFKRSKNQFEEFQKIIDNFNYRIPKLQEMNQLNLTQLKEKKRAIKQKQHANVSWTNSTKSSPRKDDQSMTSKNEVDVSLQQYYKEKKRVNRIDKGQYKIEIKNSQREVLIARINQGSIQQISSSNEVRHQGNKAHREYLISMVDGQLIKPYTPLCKLRKEDSRETCYNSRINEVVSRKQSFRNGTPKTYCSRLNEKMNDITQEEDDQASNMEFPELILQRQYGYFEKQSRKRQKQEYTQEFVQKVNDNEIKLVKQCQDFYTTRMKFNDKFTQLVNTLHKDRPLTSSLRSRSITTSHQNQKQEKIHKIRQVAEKARQNFFFRNKEQREWHEQLLSSFKQLDATCQYIFEQLQYILEEGLFIQVDDIINMVQQIQCSNEMKVTAKCCKVIHAIFTYFGIEITKLDQHSKFKNFSSYID